MSNGLRPPQTLGRIYSRATKLHTRVDTRMGFRVSSSRNLVFCRDSGFANKGKTRQWAEGTGCKDRDAIYRINNAENYFETLHVTSEYDKRSRDT